MQASTLTLLHLLILHSVKNAAMSARTCVGRLGVRKWHLPCFEAAQPATTVLIHYFILQPTTSLGRLFFLRLISLGTVLGPPS